MSQFWNHRSMKREASAMEKAVHKEPGRDAAVQTTPGFKISQSAVRLTNAGCSVARLTEMNDVKLDGIEVPATISQNTVSLLRQQHESANESDRKLAIAVAVDILRALDYFFWPYLLKQKPEAAAANGVGNTQIKAKELRQKPALNWHDVKRSKLAACLNRLCSLVQPLFAAEPRCYQLHQPVYVLGDLHGNYEDLHEFQRLFWPLGPENSVANVLFLGDYVDRGNYGLEVVAYLFALKIMAPNKVYLLRGNHELRQQQVAFNFKAECIDKLGAAHGEIIWNAINVCFDYMPLAAVIDDKIFCVHGGIPHPLLLQRLPGIHRSDLVSTLNQLCPCPATTFDVCSAPWELLWNDPIWDDASLRKLDGYGFCPNTKRGTGHEFSHHALDAFLKRYGLSHVIRAHQVQAAGFQLRYSARCLTVFSSSMYSGLENEAAVVIVDKSEIKPVRISRQGDRARPSMEKTNERQQKEAEPNAEKVSWRNAGVFAKRLK